MGYKPTGRPNGRPRKAAVEQAEIPTKRKGVPSRARARFRQIAEALNPSPFVVMRDARGRPRHAPRHTNVKA